MNIDSMTPYQFDMALVDPVFHMMRRGIMVDEDRKIELAIEAHERWDELQEKLDMVAGGHLNVNSPKQLKSKLYGDLGLPARRQRGKLTTAEDKLRSLLATCEDKIRTLKTESGKERWKRGFAIIKLTLLIRGVRKELSSYLGCPPGCKCKNPSQVLVDPDGRMRCTISIGGAETGRFSHSKTLWGTGVNMATIPRKLRTMFIPTPGYELAEFDLNRGESWVYAHLSGDPDLIDIHQSGRDFHAETAAAISSAFGGEPLTYGWIVDNKEDEAYKLRYLGKRVNHASAYRMGPFKAAEVVNEEADETGITVTVSQMKEAQKLWIDKYFGIQGWWDSIDRTLDRTRTLTTPYGRVRTFYGWMGDQLQKEATAYVPQSTSVDYLNRGMLRVFNELVRPETYGLELLHQNHDSILVEYPAQYRNQVFPVILELLVSEVEINGWNVSIPVEGSYGRNWKELTGWRG